MKNSEKLVSMLTNRERADFMAFSMPRMDNEMTDGENAEMIEDWLNKEYSVEENEPDNKTPLERLGWTRCDISKEKTVFLRDREGYVVGQYMITFIGGTLVDIDIKDKLLDIDTMRAALITAYTLTKEQNNDKSL